MNRAGGDIWHIEFCRLRGRMTSPCFMEIHPRLLAVRITRCGSEFISSKPINQMAGAPVLPVLRCAIIEPFSSS
jgi:hypothetical protein